MENTKKCTKCGKELLLDQFYPRKYKSGRIGHASECKKCDSASMADWRKNNPEKSRAADVRWRENNPEKCRESGRRWRQANSEYLAEYNKLRKKRNPGRRLTGNIRSAIWRALNNNIKADHTEELLGCSIGYLRIHLENQFMDDMNWDNYGVHGWHIDHIIPLSYFDMSDPEQQTRAWHYTNLRPLWAKDNIQKSNKIIEIQLVLL